MLHEPILTGVAPYLEALKTGVSTSIIGMLIVFAVLAVIFAALVLMRKLLTKKPKEAPAPISEKQEEAPVLSEEPASDDTAVIAAIIAAISAHTGKAPVEFRVVSFKRRH